MEDSNEIDEIREYMLSNKDVFIEQPSNGGRRFSISGKPGLVYFKWILGGWSYIVDGNRTLIDSIQTLQSLINAH